MSEDETFKSGITSIPYADILANEPNDPAAKVGYDELRQAWRAMTVDFEAGRTMAEAEFVALMQRARRAMNLREASFFEEPHEAGVAKNKDWFQAKIVGRLTKILLDRHGYKASKKSGGLG